jgi:hypothetical protein
MSRKPLSFLVSHFLAENRRPLFRKMLRSPRQHLFGRGLEVGELASESLFRPLPGARVHARRLERPECGFAVASMFTAEFEDRAARLRETLERAGVDYVLYAVPAVHRSLTAKGSNDIAFAKPNFIHHAMGSCSARSCISMPT